MIFVASTFSNNSLSEYVHCPEYEPPVFTARCTLLQSAVLRSHVVCPSVRLSVTLVDCDHIGWNSSEIISPLVSLGCSLSAEPNIRVLQGEHPEILAQSDPPLLIWASETFDRKLRPNGYRECNGHNGEPIGNHYRSHRRKQKVNSSAGDSSVSVSRMSDGRLFHKSWTKHEKTSDTECVAPVWRALVTS